MWHPSKRNYLSVPFIRDRNNSRACGKILEIPEERTGRTANPFRGGGMAIFWNHTFQCNLT